MGQERLIRSAPIFAARKKVVVGTVDRAQAPGQVVGRDQAARTVKRLASSIRFGDLDVEKDGIQIAADIFDHD